MGRVISSEGREEREREEEKDAKANKDAASATLARRKKEKKLKGQPQCTEREEGGERAFIAEVSR